MRAAGVDSRWRRSYSSVALSARFFRPCRSACCCATASTEAAVGLSKSGTLLDPRFDNITITRPGMYQLVTDQWPSRSRAVHSRAEIDAALKQGV